MNDWLSKIEAVERKYRIEYQRVLKAIGRGKPPETPAERMARVIRELAEYAPIVELEEKCVAYSNLSDDAKEIVK